VCASTTGNILSVKDGEKNNDSAILERVFLHQENNLTK